MPGQVHETHSRACLSSLEPGTYPDTQGTMLHDKDKTAVIREMLSESHVSLPKHILMEENGPQQPWRCQMPAFVLT